MNDEAVGDLRNALLKRLKFEREMGIECARPVAPASRGAAKPETAPRAEPPALAPNRTPETPSPAPAVDRAKELFTAEQDLAGLSDSEKAARWHALEARALACTRCALHKGRNKVVFGEGDRKARLVFVGEGPGEQEDLSGRPFVGKAGQLLDKIIGAMGLKREQVYICNVVKCRPPGNRTPLPDEVALCQPFLEEQIALIAPKAIVALGSPAAKALLKTNQGIMALRGRWHLYRGVRVMPTYHPAFVLRQYTEETRRAVWGDMQQVVKFLKEG